MVVQSPFLWALFRLSQEAGSYRAQLVAGHESIERINLLAGMFDRLPVAALGSAVLLSVYLFVAGVFPGRGNGTICSGDRKPESHSLKPANNAWLHALLLSACFYYLVMTRFLQYPVAHSEAYLDFLTLRQFIESGPGAGQNLAVAIGSPLYLAVVFAAGKLFQSQDPALVACLINACLSCLILIGLHAFCRKTFGGDWQAIVACLVFAFSGFAVSEVSGGKETLIVDLIVVASLISLAYKRISLFCWTSALMCLVRPEGAIWFVASLILALAEVGKNAWRVYAPPAVAVSIAMAGLAFFFAFPFHNEMAARQVVFQCGLDTGARTPGAALSLIGRETFGSSLIVLLSWTDSLAQQIKPIPAFVLERTWLAQSLQGVLSLFLVGVLGKQHQALRFYFYCCVLFLLYFSFTNPYHLPWYCCWFNLVPPLAVSVLLGRLWAVPLRRGTVAFRAAVLLVTCYLIVHPVLWSRHELLWKPESDVVIAFKKAAELLGGGANLASLATTDPGPSGYYLFTRTKVLDVNGVASPQCLAYYPVPGNDYSRRFGWMSVPVDLVLKLKPEALLALDIYLDNGLIKNETFMKEYRLVSRWPCSTWGARGLLLFVRTDRLRQGFDESKSGGSI